MSTKSPKKSASKIGQPIKPATYTFTDAEQIQLRTLNEYVLLYSHQIRRLVGFFADSRGINPDENQVAFDLDKMIFTVSAEPKTKKWPVYN